MNGWLVLDKPAGMTSRDAVNAVQRLLPRGAKLGHTGTLDPLATGVLVLCVGSATRLAELVQSMGKTYRSRFRLGATSDTDDADGTIEEQRAVAIPTASELHEAMSLFVGEIDQVPPAYSALKVGGRRAHELARRGDAAALPARRVRVDAVRVLSYDWPTVEVEIECGKGTYIRSIARDLGAGLHVGGLVESLRRTRVGPFLAEDAIRLDADPSSLRAGILPLNAATVQLPRVSLDADSARRFCQGQHVQMDKHECRIEASQDLAVLDEFGELLGLGACLVEGTIRASIVLRR